MSTIKCKVINITTGPNCKPPENIGALTPSSSSTELHTKSADDERIKKENAAAATLQGVVRGKKQREQNKREKTKQEEVKNLQEELKKLTSQEEAVYKDRTEAVNKYMEKYKDEPTYHDIELPSEVEDLQKKKQEIKDKRSIIQEKLDKLNSSVGGKKLKEHTKKSSKKIKRTHKKKSSNKRKTKPKHKTIKKN